MARGIPRTKNVDAVAPIKDRRLTNVPLARIGAFRSVNERKNDKTGEVKDVVQIKLSLDWDTGRRQVNEDGDLILDEAGDPRIHYINDGFVTLSGDKRGNLIKVLKALGFEDERFISEEGGLTDDAAESLEVVFGTNGLGGDYAGADWDDLPIYVLKRDGGKDAKRDVEVPVKSLKLLGYEIIGRTVDMQLTIDDGWNRVEAYLLPADFQGLDAAPAPKAKPAKTKPGVPRSSPRKGMDQVEGEVNSLMGGGTEDPFNDDTPFDGAPTTKRAIYVTRALKSGGVPGTARIPFVAHLLEDADFTSIASINGEDATTFRALVEVDGGEPSEIAATVKRLYKEYRDNVGFAETEAADPPWDDEDSDF